MQKPINTGILSFGMSGTLFHAPFLKVHPGFDLTAVVERSEKKAHLQFPDIKSFGSVDEIIADPDIELIIVNTPNYTHFEYALKAIRSGKHVLVEKPFAVSSNEAKLLFEEAKKYNRYVLPFQNRRYDSDFLSVTEVIGSNKLGQLVEVHIRYDRYRYTIGPKVAKETPMPGSGLLYDLGPHLLDMVILLFGKPIGWTKTLGHYRPKTQVNDYATIHLKYPHQLQVFVTMSMLVSDLQPAFIINGTRGSYVKNRTDIQEEQLLEKMSPTDLLYGLEKADNEGILTLIDEEGKRSQERISSGKGSYLNLFNAVYDTLKNNKSYPITEEQIIQQIIILEENPRQRGKFK